MDICDEDNDKTKNSLKNNRKSKRMPIWLLVIIDALLTCVCLGAFMLYHYVLPRHLTSENIVVATVGDSEDTSFTLPGNETSPGKENGTGNKASDTTDSESGSGNVSNSGSDKEAAAGSVTPTPKTSEEKTSDSEAAQSNRNASNKGRDSNGHITNYGNGDTMDVDADQSERRSFSSKEKTITQVNSYSSENIQFTTGKVEVGSGGDKITYYVSDIYVSNVKYLKTAFAKGQYGKNYRESTLEQAMDNNALLAINGDYYGNNEIGVVIRNGVLYRSEVYDADLCVLFTDGTMKTYSPGEFKLEDIIKQGAWQAWIFGPQLLDGNGSILSKFSSTYYLNLSHPRTAIGYVEPGHYVFLVVDGRNEGYSRGATLTEMAQMMADAGCVYAYNLDGGQSSEMVYEDEFVNQPSKGGRDVSDIIYIGE